MRCLVIAPFVPFPPHDGGRMRVHALLRGLAREHDVELLTLAQPAEEQAAAELRGEGVDVETVAERPRLPVTALRALAGGRSLYAERYRSRAFTRRLRERLERGRYDVVQCEFSYMAQYREGVPRVHGERWVLDEHNVEFRLNETLGAVAQGAGGAAYRAYARREGSLRRREELAACRTVDHVVTVSDVDRAVLEEQLPGLPASVVPNGIDLAHFHPPAEERERRPAAVFVGKLDYRPNIDALGWFCDQILPLVRARVPDFELRIVGRSPALAVRELARHSGVVLVGPVDDTRSELWRASAAVIPLRAGSGTRLKLLEALASGTPVVTTPLGAEGIDVEDGRHALVADAPDAFAGAVADLLGDPARGRALAAAGRALAEDRYGWDAAAAALVAVLERVVGSPELVEGRS